MVMGCPPWKSPKLLFAVEANVWMYSVVTADPAGEDEGTGTAGDEVTTVVVVSTLTALLPKELDWSPPGELTSDEASVEVAAPLPPVPPTASPVCVKKRGSDPESNRYPLSTPFLSHDRYSRRCIAGQV